MVPVRGELGLVLAWTRTGSGLTTFKEPTKSGAVSFKSALSSDPFFVVRGVVHSNRSVPYRHHYWEP